MMSLISVMLMVEMVETAAMRMIKLNDELISIHSLPSIWFNIPSEHLGLGKPETKFGLNKKPFLIFCIFVASLLLKSMVIVMIVEMDGAGGAISSHDLEVGGKSAN